MAMVEHSMDPALFLKWIHAAAAWLVLSAMSGPWPGWSLPHGEYGQPRRRHHVINKSSSCPQLGSNHHDHGVGTGRSRSCPLLRPVYGPQYCWVCYTWLNGYVQFTEHADFHARDELRAEAAEEHLRAERERAIEGQVRFTQQVRRECRWRIIVVRLLSKN